MDNVKETRNCLICSAVITECHLGVDSCRACSVFYKRFCNNNRPPVKCKGCEGKCVERGATGCKKCRFDRFAEVLSKASARDNETEKIPEVPHIICDPAKLCKTEEKSESKSTFIDHTTLMLDLPPCSTTPLLDKMRRSYSLFCMTRKSGETATKPIAYHLSQGEFDGSKIRFVPATYSVIVPNMRILASAMCDFASMTFPDFGKLSALNRGWCIENSFRQVAVIDATYRSEHYFPNELHTYFASYTTIVSEATIGSFLDDCPMETNFEEAMESFKSGMERARSMNREFFHRVKPDDFEFLALLGLAFWNTEVAIVNEELSDVVERNREVILNELQSVYKARGRKDYATRLGELFVLLDNMEECVTLDQHDIEIYRLQNMFNEFFPHGPATVMDECGKHCCAVSHKHT
ncbi:hypothetical protein PRIPAC_80487 [Pristionchus pacificus]|uniref:Nuclear receptor n=1 Tax=Pristionchus pacificus TaxID=54126 RepID=A0A2A6BW01_PRIPA|nr:hypothetical protein PRIPAC_80487 [Pristionchus pacificus]|eukprot:PDM70065.1 nuclear receptor [Pristionchus pacificus]